MLNLDTSVASTVLEYPPSAEVFFRYRIDFCCRGEISVREAAESKGLKPEALLDELKRAAEGVNGAAADPRELGTAELIEHIVTVHHGLLRSALPFVRQLASKVARVHGKQNPKLIALDEAVATLADSLLPHLDDEEKDLFPTLIAASAAADAQTAESVEKMGGYFREMMDDHLEVAGILERMREATEDYELPEWACTSYRTLFAELERVERDTYEHVHLENHVLMPRFAS